MPATPSEPSRPRRRRRLLIAGAALAAVAIALPAADALARERGESRLADRIAARHQDLRSAPQVRIGGYPFLLDAARGSHPEVRVTADGRAPDGRPVKAAVDLKEVTQGADGYSAAAVDARFTVPFDALAGEAGKGVRLSDAGDGQLRVERSAFGISAVVTARLQLKEDTVTLQATKATLAGRPIDPANPLIAEALAGKRWELPALPLGLRASEVSVGPDGVTARAHGERLTLS
ncbi:LmeA family phospholipid-binding protein [Streptomyces sp. NPDC004244]|uniref:LmeA family phospholipid-binding protein n=1 Tax=Streptomyces sp. NPDC101206 TaxID=3366128 RepID=UPI003825B9D8